jgi:hypothetical protein
MSTRIIECQSSPDLIAVEQGGSIIAFGAHPGDSGHVDVLVNQDVWVDVPHEDWGKIVAHLSSQGFHSPTMAQQWTMERPSGALLEPDCRSGLVVDSAKSSHAHVSSPRRGRPQASSARLRRHGAGRRYHHLREDLIAMKDECEFCTARYWPVATVSDTENEHGRACQRCAELYQRTGNVVLWDEEWMNPCGDQGQGRSQDVELQAVHMSDGSIIWYEKTDRDRRVDETMDRVAREIEQEDRDLPSLPIPLTVASESDKVSYLDWVGGILYGLASANLDMN